MHETSRLLSSGNTSAAAPAIKSESSSSTTPGRSGGHRRQPSKPVHRTLEELLRDLNPDARLVIRETLSPKPASLTYNGPGEGGAAGGGGFLTGGVAEKMLLTRCQILKDSEDTQAGYAKPREVMSEPIDNPPESVVEEGLVVFSLTSHSKTSSSTTSLALSRPAAGRHTSVEAAKPKDQTSLDYKPVVGRSLLLPNSIADLHTQLQVGHEIWAWEPWTVVNVANDSGNTDGARKALLVSRFAVLL